MAYKDPEKQRAWGRENYKRRAEHERQRSRLTKAKTSKIVRSFLDEYVKNKACVDCGENDPIVLEFDHIDPYDKKHRISQMRTGNYTLEAVKIEVDKCTIRCANCHRRLTYRQRREGIIKSGYHPK